MQLRESFGPGDVTTLAVVPGGSMMIDEIRDFSSSSHFDQQPVRVLGSSLPVGWATGAGSYAGTLVCQQFERAALWKLRRYAGAAQMMNDDPEAARNASKADLDFWTRSVQLQQLPPFHLYFIHHSEAGSMGIARLYGVKISSVGEVKGQGQARTEETMQYQALFYEQLELHRSLSPGEITDITGKSQSFFGGYKADPGSLATDTLSVAGSGALGVQEYVESEAAELASREASGRLTTLSIAREGDLVWGREEEGLSLLSPVQPDPPALESASADSLDVNARSGSASVTETFPTKNGAAITSEAALYVRGGRLFIEEGPVDESWEPALSEPSLGTISAEGQISISGSRYASRFFDTGELLFAPERVELDILFSEGGRIQGVNRQAFTGIVSERVPASGTPRIGSYDSTSSPDEWYTISEGPVLSGEIAGETFEVPFQGDRAQTNLSIDGSLVVPVNFDIGSDGTNYYVKRRMVAGRGDHVFFGPAAAREYEGSIRGYNATLSWNNGMWTGQVLGVPVSGAQTDLGGGFAALIEERGEDVFVTVEDGGRSIG